MKLKKNLTLLSRLIFGAVFLYSGFVKAVDPWGFAYKIIDYLDAFQMGFLSPLALLAGFVLPAVEILIGVNLFLGIALSKTKKLAALFMLVMTPLTLYLALNNPVADCGCFGEAFIITNWETFWKNIILCVLLLPLFIGKQSLPIWKPLTEKIFIVLALVSSLTLSWYCYEHLPIVDFRAYEVGSNIIEGMQVPEDATFDEYAVSFIYEKDGVQEEFDLSNYPCEDTTWKFVSQSSSLIKKGYVPPVHDFSIETLDGIDITDLVLEKKGYTFLLIVTRLEQANWSEVEKIKSLAAYAKKNAYGFICLTASTEEQIDTYTERYKLNFPCALTDEITLKTVVRAKPGLLLIKDATILGKWHYNDFPTENDLIPLIF